MAAAAVGHFLGNFQNLLEPITQKGDSLCDDTIATSSGVGNYLHHQQLQRNNHIQHVVKASAIAAAAAAAVAVNQQSIATPLPQTVSGGQQTQTSASASGALTYVNL